MRKMHGQLTLKSQCILWWIHSGPFCLFSSCNKPFPKAFSVFYTSKSKPKPCTRLPQIFVPLSCRASQLWLFDFNALHIVPIQMSVISSVLNAMFKSYMSVSTSINIPTLCYILLQFWIQIHLFSAHFSVLLFVTVVLNMFSCLQNFQSRSQWTLGLRLGSAVVGLPWLWVRIPPWAWMLFCCDCCVLSGRGLCDELITCLGKSYWLWCVVVCDLETSWIRRPCPTGGCRAIRRRRTRIFRLLTSTSKFYFIF